MLSGAAAALMKVTLVTPFTTRRCRYCSPRRRACTFPRLRVGGLSSTGAVEYAYAEPTTISGAERKLHRELKVEEHDRDERAEDDRAEVVKFLRMLSPYLITAASSPPEAFSVMSRIVRPSSPVSTPLACTALQLLATARTQGNREYAELDVAQPQRRRRHSHARAAFGDCTRACITWSATEKRVRDRNARAVQRGVKYASLWMGAITSLPFTRVSKYTQQRREGRQQCTCDAEETAPCFLGGELALEAGLHAADRAHACCWMPPVRRVPCMGRRREAHRDI